MWDTLGLVTRNTLIPTGITGTVRTQVRDPSIEIVGDM